MIGDSEPLKRAEWLEEPFARFFIVYYEDVQNNVYLMK